MLWGSFLPNLTAKWSLWGLSWPSKEDKTRAQVTKMGQNAPQKPKIGPRPGSRAGPGPPGHGPGAVRKKDPPMEIRGSAKARARVAAPCFRARLALLDPCTHFRFHTPPPTTHHHTPHTTPPTPPIQCPFSSSILHFPSSIFHFKGRIGSTL